jgi:K+ transporter
MPAAIVREDDSALARVARKTTPAAALAALGIVYGDLGTSPLYTLQAVVRMTGGHLSPDTALGSLSLIFWALIITISVKYCLFVMRADNQGEGGILALMSMTGANWTEGRRRHCHGNLFLLIITHPPAEAATSDSNRLALRSSQRERPLLA